MGIAANIQDTTTDLRVGRRIHCILYGGRDGVISAVDGKPGVSKSRSALGGAVVISSGSDVHIDVVWDDGSVSLRIPECIATGVQWRFLDEDDYTQAQIDAAKAFAKETAEKAEAEKKAAAEAFDRAVKAMRENEEFKHLEQAPEGAGMYSRQRDNMTAKNVRKTLKKAFPGVKFSVRKRSCDALYVSWSREDDGETVNQRTVSDAVAMFKTGTYNAYEDYHGSNSSAFNVVYGGFDFIFCQRD